MRASAGRRIGGIPKLHGERAACDVHERRIVGVADAARSAAHFACECHSRIGHMRTVRTECKRVVPREPVIAAVLLVALCSGCCLFGVGPFAGSPLPTVDGPEQPSLLEGTSGT